MTMALRSSSARVGAFVVALAVVISAFAFCRGKQGSSSDPSGTSRPSGDGLEVVSRSAVFFGHQSVGLNIIDGIPAVYSAAGVAAPRILESATPPEVEAAVAHTFIGQNGDPSSKVTDFASALRSGYGAWANAAFMKFCYVDFVAGTDVEAVFAEYKATMSALEQEFPDLTFLYLTVPLTTEPGAVDRLKVMIGRGVDHRSDNVVREEFNALVRDAYGETGRLLDVAALESTTPEGGRVTGTSDGQTYYALHGGYASDSGHLNDVGAQVVAGALVDILSSNLKGR